MKGNLRFVAFCATDFRRIFRLDCVVALDRTQRHIRELTRKVTIYEVNEMNLSRRYTSLMEQLHAESREKQQLQVDIAELEGTLKARILFLEQHKMNAASHLAKLQQQLDASVPAVSVNASHCSLFRRVRALYQWSYWDFVGGVRVRGARAE